MRSRKIESFIRLLGWAAVAAALLVALPMASTGPAALRCGSKRPARRTT